MPATKLHTHRVEKPWGRRTLFPGFDDVPEGGAPVGEVWFQEPGDSKPDLLIKYLFTSEKLSVQVHPNDEQAHERGLPRGKDECWTVLKAEPDATIAVGTTAPMSRDKLRADAKNGTIEGDLSWKSVKAGDFLYCASDTIHAIGGGLTVIEVQQNSETTYRLYDYGSDRELHLDDGMAVADPNPYVPIVSPGPAGEGRRIMVEGPKFVLERWSGAGERPVALPAGTTAWLVPIKGQGEVAGVDWQAGECVTLTGSETVSVGEGADVLLAYPGTRRVEMAGALIAGKARRVAAALPLDGWTSSASRPGAPLIKEFPMTLFRNATLLAGIAGVAIAATPAAATRYTSHPRRTEVNGRLFDQQHRINAGVKDGQLTHAEAHQLRTDDRGIYGEEKQMAKLDGGHITKADQKSLNQQENAVSKDIYTDRHN